MTFELQERLKGELKKNKVLWLKRIAYDSQQEVRWLPVVSLRECKLDLGLSLDGKWVRSTESHVSEFEVGGSCVFFLPVLEVGFDKAFDSIVEGLVRNDLSKEFVALFPFEEIVIAALNSGSEYWEKLALGWVEPMSYPKCFEQHLSGLVETGFTQFIRHRAKKLLGLMKERRK